MGTFGSLPDAVTMRDPSELKATKATAEPCSSVSKGSIGAGK
jgi:hypothetical protein